MSMQLSAVHLATATANDPQFRLPEHPCLAEGIVLTWTAKGLLVEGTGTRRVLTGRSAQQILPGLTPLLDGSRSLPDLAGLTGLDAQRVRAVLLLLYSCGMLQEGPHPEPERSTAQYALLSRLLDTTRVNVSAGEAQARLAATTVVVVAPEPFAGALATHLRASGMTVVVSDSVGAVDPETGLAVVWVDRDCEASARQSCSAMYRAGVSVLLVGSDTAGFSIGPYSALDHGACPTCCLASWPLGPVELDREPRETAAALTAIEVVALVSRVGAPLSIHGRIVTDLVDGRSDTVLAARRPGCPECGDPAVVLRDPPVAFRFEHSVAFPARRLVNPRDHQHHFEPANVALQYDTKAATGRRALPLPPPRRSREQARPDGAGPMGCTSVSDVATVLALAFGLKMPPAENQPVRRWAPTGGNLGSPQAYLVAHDVAGLAPGVYSYLPAGHELEVVSDEPPWPRPEGTAATVIMTGALMRVAKKYRTFAYRVVHLDAGAALSHAVLAAGGVDLTLVNHAAWDDVAIARATGTDPDTEIVTGVFDLRAAR